MAAYHKLTAVAIIRSFFDNASGLNANRVSVEPIKTKVNEATCHVTRKTRSAAGASPVDATVNFGKISRSPRYACPQAPKNCGRAARRNKGLVMG